LANGWLDAGEEHVEEGLPLKLPYLLLVVVGDACRAGRLLVDEDVLSLDG
jgi:hypothetical protein